MEFTRFKGILAASSAVLLLASASWAQSPIYIQFGDGRVIQTNQSYSRTYVDQGGRVVHSMPSGYVSDPYSYNNGNPVYYKPTYWQSHNRKWKDKRYKWENGQGHGRGHDRDRDDRR